MISFKNNQRVIVSDPDGENEPLRGKFGTVVRLRMGDSAAWVNMDETLPVHLQSFSPLDLYGNVESRHKHIMLWPDECGGVDPENTEPTSPETSAEAKA